MNFLNPLRAVLPVRRKKAAKPSAPLLAAAGAAIRYQAVHADEKWKISSRWISPCAATIPTGSEHLPPEIDSQLVHKLYYGHFMCHVFIRPYREERRRRPCAESANAGVAVRRSKHTGGAQRWTSRESAETLTRFYRQNDPTNSMEPRYRQNE